MSARPRGGGARPRRRGVLRGRGEAARRAAGGGLRAAGRGRPEAALRPAGAAPPRRWSTLPTSPCSAAGEAAPGRARAAPTAWSTRHRACGSSRRATTAVDASTPRTLAVIATGKRTGKTAVAGHLGAPAATEHDPLIVCMGRGGPAEPVLVEAAPGSTTSLRSPSPAPTLRPTTSRTPCWRASRPSAAGGSAAGWRARRPSRTCSPAPRWPPRCDRARSSSRARAPASRRSRPTARVCIVGPGEPRAARRYRLLRADLVLAHARRPGAAGGAALRAAARARRAAARRREGGALHHGRPSLRGRRRGGGLRQPRAPQRPGRRPRPRRGRGLRRLAHRAQGGGDRHRRRPRRRAEGARVVFIRNRPVGDGLDAALSTCSRCTPIAARRSWSTRATGSPTARASWRRRCPPPRCRPSARSSSPGRSSAVSSSAAEAEIDVAALRALAEEVLLAEEGDTPCGATGAGAGSTASTARSWC